MACPAARQPTRPLSDGRNPAKPRQLNPFSGPPVGARTAPPAPNDHSGPERGPIPTKPPAYRSADLARLGATACYRRTVVMTGGKGPGRLAAVSAAVPIAARSESAQGRQLAGHPRAAPRARSPAEAIGTRDRHQPGPGPEHLPTRRAAAPPRP